VIVFPFFFRFSEQEGEMRIFPTVGLAMLAGLYAQAEECTVIVRVTSESTVPIELTRAEAMAGRMFQRIGTRVRWTRDGAPAVNSEDACDAPIDVRLEHSPPARIRPESLAYAAPYAVSGTRIHIFFDRVVESGGQRRAVRLLAHVLAHELTHVLEGLDRHSPTGVMKAHWSSLDYEAMMVAPLPFSAVDVELIHLGVSRLDGTRGLSAAASTRPNF
jgi:hypothetical protein